MSAIGRKMIWIGASVATATLVAGLWTAAVHPPRPSIHASFTKPYTSTAELLQDSTAVVIVEPVSSTVLTLHDVPFTRTTVRATRVISGLVSDTTFTIQQLGSTNVDLPDTSPLLVPSKQYLLFVRPWDLGAGPVPGIYVITGDQGAYELSGTAFRYAGSALAKAEGLPGSLNTVQVDGLANTSVAN